MRHTKEVTQTRQVEYLTCDICGKDISETVFPGRMTTEIRYISFIPWNYTVNNHFHAECIIEAVRDKMKSNPLTNKN